MLFIINIQEMSHFIWTISSLITMAYELSLFVQYCLGMTDYEFQVVEEIIK